DPASGRQKGSAVTGPAERLRDTLTASTDTERRLRGELRVGFLYDSNVQVIPQPSHDPTAESLRYANTASPGELFSLRLEYAWLRTGPWESTVSYSFFQTISNQFSSFNVQDNLLPAGVSARGSFGSMPYQLGAQYTWDYLTLGGDFFLQRNTVTLFGTLVENQMNLTTILRRF